MLLEQNKPLVSSEVTSTLHSRFTLFNVLYPSLYFVHTGRPMAPQYKHDLRTAFSILSQRIRDRSYREEQSYHTKYHSSIAWILYCFTCPSLREWVFMLAIWKRKVGMNVAFRSWQIYLGSGKFSEVLYLHVYR